MRGLASVRDALRMHDKVNLAEKAAGLDGPWRPGIVGTFNDCKIAVFRAQDEFVWHAHPDTDDLFLVLDGRLTIQLRDRDVELGPGELFVVPRGVEHCPRGEAHALLMEPLGTPNTGDAGGPLTAGETEI